MYGLPLLDQPLLGGCDPDAPQQYDETRTRYEFLSSQIADMEQAALHLHLIIEQLDTTMAKQFEVTFHAVNTRFREHFTTLFHGGSARLELTSSRASEEGRESLPAGGRRGARCGFFGCTAGNPPLHSGKV